MEIPWWLSLEIYIKYDNTVLVGSLLVVLLVRDHTSHWKIDDGLAVLVAGGLVSFAGDAGDSGTAML